MSEEPRASEERTPRQTTGYRWRRAGLVLVAIALVLCALWAVLIAQAFGPGSSDEIVTGGLAAVLWFGLSAAGLAAAAFALWRASDGQLRAAGWAAILAVACLAGWTVLLIVAG